MVVFPSVSGEESEMLGLSDLNGVLPPTAKVTIPCLPMVDKHEFHETCHSVIFHFVKKDFKRCCDTTTPESIHTKDESKRDFAFAFIFGVN